MPKKRITLKDIADQLGLSIPTVSRALKDYPDISKETKKAVLDLVDKLHYVPNSLALNLRKNKSNIIGVIIPEVVHFFFSSVIKGIMETADQLGYSVLLTQSEEKLMQEMKQAKLLFSSHVDGLLVCLSDETKSCEHFQVFQEFKIPLVLFDKVNDSHEGSQVVVDDRVGAYQATEHLIHQGCKKIIFLKGTNDPLNALERLKGYREALESYQIPFNEQLIKSCNSITRQEAYKLIKSCIQNQEAFDGVLGVSDILAIGALGACQDSNLKIPKDVCIVGFSDSEMCQISRPQLTSVYQPGFEMGQRSAEKLIREIEAIEKDEPYRVDKIELQTNLRIRDSSNRKRLLT
ncbi:MAG: LacI family DNA-binding transcriptional regulator [Bacteroidota bacterium]